MRYHHLSFVIDCNWSGSIMTLTLQYLLSLSLFLSPHSSSPFFTSFHFLFSSPFISCSPTRPVDSAETSRSPLCNTEKQRLISPTQPRLRREEEEEEEGEKEEQARRILLTKKKNQKENTHIHSPTVQLLNYTTWRFLTDFSLIHLPLSSSSLHLHFPCCVCPSPLHSTLISSPCVFLTWFGFFFSVFFCPLCTSFSPSSLLFHFPFFPPTVFIVFHFGTASLHWQTSNGC